MEKRSPAVEVDADQLLLWNDKDEKDTEVSDEHHDPPRNGRRVAAGRAPDPVLDRLWDVKDVSAFRGVPVPTIYQWRVKGGGPPATRMGKHLRFEPATVRSWVSEHREGA